MAVFSAPVMPSISFAQSSSTSNDTGHIEERIRPERPPEGTDFGPNLDIAPDRTPVAETEKFSFVLSAVVIEGKSVFSAEELAPIYSKYLAQQVTEVDVRAIAEAITDRYQDAGYVFSQADVPPQDVLGGVLRIQVTEGFVERVEYGLKEGDGIIAAYLAPVLTEKPVRLETIERALLLINDLPDVTVADSQVKEGTAPGAKVLDLTFEMKPLSADLYLDNRGTPASGRLQAWAAAGLNGLLQTGNRLQLGVFTIPNQPKELIFVQGKWSQPIGGWGTRAEFSVSGSTSDQSGNDTDSDTLRATLSLRHPILRSRKSSLWLSGELDYYNVNEDVSGSVSFRDRHRTARVGMEYYHPSVLNGDLYGKAQYSRGLGVLAASEEGDSDLSRTDGVGDFNKITLDIRRLQKLFAGFGIYAQAKGQWADAPVLSAEEFALGGSQVGRAFDFSELVGDRGAGGLVELRFTGEKPTDWLQSYDLYAFYDGGFVWNDGSGRSSLTSFGGGVRATLKHNIYGDLQVARPLSREVSTEGNKDLRILFSLGAGL